MSKNKGALGKAVIIAGIVLIISALCLLAYNVFYSLRSSRQASAALNSLREQIEINRRLSEESAQPELIPEMPRLEIDGRQYIGIVEVPGVDIELPVLADWDDADSSVAPARFSGSVFDGSLVIAGHNIYSHFKKLVNTSLGDEVFFTDCNGALHKYKISEFIIFDDMEGLELLAGDWDLTMFTCTYDSSHRFTVRCYAVD